MANGKSSEDDFPLGLGRFLTVQRNALLRSGAIFLLEYNFGPGPAPVAPFPSCGRLVSLEDEALGCENGTPWCLNESIEG